MSKIIVTSALIYCNNVFHLGNAVGSVVSADVFSRYLKSKLHEKTDPNRKVLFIGGVDEYGTATEIKAREENLTCKQICDKYFKLHTEIYEWFNIRFDCYGRTSQPNGDPSEVQPEWPQTKITHEIFKNLCANGYVIEKEESVMYCSEIDSFVADRFVVGTCPHCRSPKADGDQCDACGKLLSATDVIDPRYKPNLDYKLQVRTTKNLYIDTDKIWQDKKMTEWFNNVKSSWTKTASSITQDWLRDGLLPRSITRDLKWGTRVPNTTEYGNSYENKVFYVWFDAPIGYISISEHALGTEASESWWKDPETKLIHFMAKDNVPFHSVVFPVTLKGSGYTELADIDIASTEYLMYEGQKFSKSKGIGLFCDDVMKISAKYNLSPDLWRAYLIFIRPENSDSNFVLNEGGFVDFVNNILINNIGNLVHRVLSIAFQIKNKHNIESIDTKSKIVHDAKLKELETEYVENMTKYKLSEALKTVFKFSSILNASINESKPWILIKDEEKTDELYVFMINMYNNCRMLGTLLEPVMPSIGRKIYDDFHLDHESERLYLPKEKPVVLIKQLDKIDIQ